MKSMGKALSLLQRSANRFNVENRAAKVISREKPTAAPKHPATLKEIEALKTDYPKFLEEHLRKDSGLDDRLKKVFVHSQDSDVAEETSTDPARSLPQDRKQVEDFLYGYKEPRMIPHGRFSLKQVLKFIVDHQADPSTWSAAAIAKEHKIDEEKLGKIFYYYRAFQIHIPEKSNTKMEIKTVEGKPLTLLENPPETAQEHDKK